MARAMAGRRMTGDIGEEASAAAGEGQDQVDVRGTRMCRGWKRMAMCARQTTVAGVAQVVRGRAEWSTSVSTPCCKRTQKRTNEMILILQPT
jgi:hypothetical protein